jgi:hypothetical protein
VRFPLKLTKLSRLPDWLDWLLSVIEPLVVLAITVVIFYTGYCLVFLPTAIVYLNGCTVISPSLQACETFLPFAIEGLPILAPAIWNRAASEFYFFRNTGVNFGQK